MLIRIITITLSFLLLLSCGYEPIYSKKKIEKNYNFSIEKITFTNQGTNNQLIRNNLTKYLNHTIVFYRNTPR